MPSKRAKADTEQPTYTHWLVKAEPESRIEKGVDVKFSIDDLEANRTTTWEGVRNHEAKKYLKTQMKVGHLCLFYASNCKVPGVAGIARVCKEGYPDHNAWDPKHPYYDPKSKKEDPTWYMVDVEFVSKLPHLVPLSLLQSLSSISSPSDLPPSLAYLTPEHLRAIAASHLLTRGRLSVQPAGEEFFEAVRMLGERGGWEEGEGRGWWEGVRKGGKGKGKGKKDGEKADGGGKKPAAGKGKTGKKAVEEDEDGEGSEGEDKSGVKEEEDEEDGGKRRSKRAKRA
ncbi:hypothetical protein JCM8097_008050 [Rhodosporidiobolus ruineniae]